MITLKELCEREKADAISVERKIGRKAAEDGSGVEDVIGYDSYSKGLSYNENVEVNNGDKYVVRFDTKKLNKKTNKEEIISSKKVNKTWSNEEEKGGK